MALIKGASFLAKVVLPTPGNPQTTTIIQIILSFAYKKKKRFRL